MGNNEILHKFYKWIEKRTRKRMLSREREIAILAYKLGIGEIKESELEE